MKKVQAIKKGIKFVATHVTPVTNLANGKNVALKDNNAFDMSNKLVATKSTNGISGQFISSQFIFILSWKLPIDKSKHTIFAISYKFIGSMI